MIFQVRLGDELQPTLDIASVQYWWLARMHRPLRCTSQARNQHPPPTKLLTLKCKLNLHHCSSIVLPLKTESVPRPRSPPDNRPDEPPPRAAQAGAGQCGCKQCKGAGVEQYMEGGHWCNDAWRPAAARACSRRGRTRAETGLLSQR